MNEQETFMRLALEQARLAAEDGETPVGAVLVREGQGIAVGRNRREKVKNARYHAEMEAIDRGCKLLGGWRLWQCDLYVTLEPCPMCAGAIINARIRTLVFGASDPKNGSFGSVADFSQLPYNHKPVIVSGVCASECGQVLTSFFASLRREKRKGEQ